MPPFLQLNSAKYWLLLVLLLVLTGCASPTTVHIYSKYFDDSELTPLVSALRENDYEVETNDFDPPASVTTNAILYSLLLDDSSKLEQVKSLVKEAGFQVNDLLPLTRANHWYTKNSMALILFPENVASSGLVFRQDLDNFYKSRECDHTLTMDLQADGNYQINGEVVNYQWAEEDKHLRSGVWYFRQFPYVELRPQNQTERSMYFEISKHKERDKISEIDMLTLSPVGRYPWIGGCVFEFGLRLTGG